ncbi:MAG: hypothetical protein A3J48_03685 [Candidatus Doudnabacteria bacterium RIFCSPHIGHO2_02_FULL_46_11]|uniref:YdbS-like PH domain-containing protein n=1 Tax=Candidatus Doudnabacteria bacterium RIFCSPHIGHO2_02_FULL_46_11 TaxID=1817832 RepID=A0A1F5P4A1_9BACT|nr:MAG: hypothetical protein A3J48_03685 [Candidatus Doudnabacteria bacterium RIFCSPHIGHO2_02_FULL_46_11]
MRVFEIDFHDNEKIVLKVRQHWIILLWPIWKFLLVSSLGVVGLYYYGDRFDLLLGMLLFVTWLLIAFDLSLHDFFRWYLNVYIVTNQRIINVTHTTIFRRQTTEAPLGRVQDVTHKTLGFISMLFNYGDVIVQTAGHQTLIHFEMVPKPKNIHREITRVVANYHHQPIFENKPKFIQESV